MYELRVIRECVNSVPALALFQQALAAEGIDADPCVVEVTSTEQARVLEFQGSPSFIAGGRDLFPSDSAPALACRVYRRLAGLAGIPSQEDLQVKLKQSQERRNSIPPRHVEQKHGPAGIPLPVVLKP